MGYHLVAPAGEYVEYHLVSHYTKVSHGKVSDQRKMPCRAFAQGFRPFARGVHPCDRKKTLQRKQQLFWYQRSVVLFDCLVKGFVLRGQQVTLSTLTCQRTQQAPFDSHFGKRAYRPPCMYSGTQRGTLAGGWTTLTRARCKSFRDTCNLQFLYSWRGQARSCPCCLRRR